MYFCESEGDYQMGKKYIKISLSAVGYILLIIFIFTYHFPKVNLPEIVTLAVFFLLFEKLSIKIELLCVTLSPVIVMTIFLINGLTVAITVSTVCIFLYMLFTSRSVEKAVIMGSMYSLQYCVAGMLFYFTGSKIGAFYTGQIVGLVVFVVTAIAINYAFMYLYIHTLKSIKGLNNFFKLMKYELAISIMTAVISSVLSELYIKLGYVYFLVALFITALIVLDIYILNNLIFANKRFHALYEMTSLINTKLDIYQVGDAIIESLKKVIIYSGIFVMLKKDDASCDIIAWDLDDRIPSDDIKTITKGEFITSVMQRMEPLLEEDISKNKIFEGENLTHYKSCMAIPLTVNDQSIGCIVVLHVQSGMYTQEYLNTVNILSKHAAIALSNASLYRDMTQKSVTDPMTKIYNHGYFAEVIEDIISICERENMVVSLIMLDIDRFKVVNDTYGHVVGDEILNQIAQRIKACVRNDDIVARYGGEEFAVILPSSNTEHAYHVAERIRSEVAAKPFVVKDYILSITLSAGVCEYPLYAKTKEDLISKADKALYSAKSSGRNKVNKYNN